MGSKAENHERHEKKVEKFQETQATTESLSLSDVGKVNTPANIFAHLKPGETERQKNAFKRSEQGKSDSKGKELVANAIKHHNPNTQAKHINELQEHYKNKLESGSRVIGYGKYTSSDGNKHDALLIKGKDEKQHAVEPESGKIVDKSPKAQDTSINHRKRTGTSDNTLTDPSGNAIEMAHPCQVDLGNGQLRLFGVAGSADAPGMKHDGNMMVSVPLDASGKPTEAPKQVQIDGLDSVLQKTGGKAGTSNPAVFKMKNGQVGMVFEVDKKNGQKTERSDFYLAVSSDGGRTFKMSNKSEPVMRGSNKDPFISVPRVVENANGGYSMYFCKTGQDHNTLAVATSRDGQSWGSPQELQVAGKGLQKGAAIMDPNVQTYTGTDGRAHYRLFFSTNNRSKTFDNDKDRTTIWMAESTDGTNFTGAREVVQPDSGALKVMDPQLVTVGSKHYLLYAQVQGGRMHLMRRPFEP